MLTAVAVLPTPPFMLYVAMTFMLCSPRPPARSRRFRQRTDSGLAARTGEADEPFGELGARLDLPDRETGGDLAHREQRRRRRAVIGHHRRCERPELGDLDVGVLKLAKAVLQRLQLVDRAPL